MEIKCRIFNTFFFGVGGQVAPAELENLLLQHPKVIEAGVIGTPDDKLGEAPTAYVVTTAPVTEAEIKEFV